VQTGNSGFNIRNNTNFNEELINASSTAFRIGLTTKIVIKSVRKNEEKQSDLPNC
jgi:GTP-sensing pleiotropic transcriptional regulator CodY